MLLVRNVMTEDVKTVSPEMDAFDVAGVMRSHDVGSAPVVDGDGHLVGIVTDRDLVIRVLGDRADPKGIRVGDVATRRSIFTISPDAQVSEARALMAAERIRRLPVVKGERLVGIVSLGDVAEADSSARAVGEALKEISASPATLERALRPDPGTPDRVMKHRSICEIPISCAISVWVIPLKKRRYRMRRSRTGSFSSAGATDAHPSAISNDGSA